MRSAVIFAGKKNARVIYTSHGYFFWNGGPFTNWVKYLTAEKVCAGVTDCIMAMNQEDFALAQKYRLCTGDVELIPGMGVDLKRFKSCDTTRIKRLRQDYGIQDDDFVIVYPAEMSWRKNHIELLKAFAVFLKNVPNGRRFLPGTSLLLEENKALAQELDILDRVIFPGYINGMEEIYPMCDLAVSSDTSVGLPLNIIEAMACGLPVVASSIRGHVDLIENKVNGYLYTPGDIVGLSSVLFKIYTSKDTLHNISLKNAEKAERYSLAKAEARIFDILKRYM